ncbi:MAG: hypothetical protein WCB36_06470 [Burkholderiales bacterium]
MLITKIERNLLLERTDEMPIKLGISLGPVEYFPKENEYRTMVTIAPLYPILAPIIGSDSFQSLSLAIKLVNALLNAEIAKGTKITWPDGTPYIPD